MQLPTADPHPQPPPTCSPSPTASSHLQPLTCPALNLSNPHTHPLLILLPLVPVRQQDKSSEVNSQGVELGVGAVSVLWGMGVGVAVVLRKRLEWT